MSFVLRRWLYTATIFLSAFLLFVVQPLAAKIMLPDFGGSSLVWNTSMVFFQALLLAGYLFTHLGVKRLGVRRHAILQLVVFAIALLFMPLGVEVEQFDSAVDSPIWAVLATLFWSVGIPYFALATTAPIIQKWFSKIKNPTSGDPYYLYAASNVGSLSGLLCYPFVVEPFWPVEQQQIGWSVSFALLVGLILTACWVLFAATEASVSDETGAEETVDVDSISWKRRGIWVLYTFIPSSLMLGVTTYITTDIAAVPLLWIVPFVLYLTTYVLAFSRRDYLSLEFSSKLVPAVVAFLLITGLQKLAPVRTMPALFIAGHLFAFFILAYVCHAEVAERRPVPQHLTEFYLWLSLGGVLGGIFNGIVAPVAFDTSVEYRAVVVLAAVVLPARYYLRFGWRELAVDDGDGRLVGLAGFALAAIAAAIAMTGDWLILTSLLFVGALLASSWEPRSFGYACVVFGVVFLSNPSSPEKAVIERERSYYNELAVTETAGTRFLESGVTSHGGQVQGSEYAQTPLLYYVPDSPVERVIRGVSDRYEAPDIGVVGLGTGCLAAYLTPGQRMVFYEIDPAVVDMARHHFTFMEKSKGDVRVEIGDARKQLRQQKGQRFRLLVLDAFSSDAIPTHLVTREAVELYTRRLRDPGVLLFHISNQYLDLRPVLGSIGRSLGLDVYVATFDPETRPYPARPSAWVLMAREGSKPFPGFEKSRWGEWRRVDPDAMWTDQYSDILDVFRWQ